MLIPGFATGQGTERFCARFAGSLPDHFRHVDGLRLSSIGQGTYLGAPTAECDRQYSAAITQAIEMGTNVIDSAINYRHQRSERAIGNAVRTLIEHRHLQRDEIFLATKGGFLAYDADPPPDPSAYFFQNVIQSGLACKEDVAADCHVITPAYLKNQIEASRNNLGVETIDLYYVHNPETQLRGVDRKEVYRRLREAFAALEEAVGEGKIRCYGAATWNAYRVSPESGEALSLPDVFHIAEEAGGAGHHFRAIQLPFNFAMLEALQSNTQDWRGQLVPLLRAASGRGLMVFASASLLQGQLADGLPDEIRKKFPGLKTDAQRSIQFVRSTPGVTCALVGMSHLNHVKENLGAALAPPLALPQYRAIFSK